MPPTIFSQNIEEIKLFFKKNRRIILKPIHSFSGNDILLMNNFNFKSVQKYIKKHDHIMSKFLPNISKGDKEFLLLMEKSVVQYQEFQKKDLF